MSRKVYYYCLAIALSFVFLVTLYNIFLRKFFGTFHIHEYEIKTACALFIVFMELYLSSGKVRTIGIILSLPLTIGFLLRIMHWPGGFYLFCGSSIGLITLILGAAVLDRRLRWSRLSMVLYPICHFVYYITQGTSFIISWWTIDLICLGLTAAFAWIWIARRQY